MNKGHLSEPSFMKFYHRKYMLTTKGDGGGGVHQAGVGPGLNPALGHPVLYSMWLHTVCPHFMKNSIIYKASLLSPPAVGIFCVTCVH